MKVTNRILFNMLAIYSKIAITMMISFITLPLVLNALGASDYGLYMLILGLITLLTFLNGSMSVSTQRYISISIGANNFDKILSIFNVSLRLHLLVGVIVVILLEIFSYFLFHDFLNIDTDRISAAMIVYQCLVFSTFFTIVSVPFDAVFNAREDFVILSLIEVFQSVLVLILTICLTFTNFDRLVFYGVGMAIITIIILLVKIVICSIRYKECSLERDTFDKKLFNEMFSYAGWNTFGAVAMMGRNQGVAIILNLFYGTVINAAYGIANQINNIVCNFSITLQKSLNPQLMKSEGSSDRIRMLYLAFLSSKFSVYILSIFVIPLIIEMPFVLRLWIKNVPNNTILFSQLILLMSIVYQYSVGIMSAIQSGGNVRNYQLSISSLLLLNLPISYFLLKFDFPIYTVFVNLIVIEIFSLVTRIFYAKRLVNLNIYKFVKEVIFPSVFVIFISFSFSLLPSLFLQESFMRFVLTAIISFITLCILIWGFGLLKVEKDEFAIIFSRVIKRKTIIK